MTMIPQFVDVNIVKNLGKELLSVVGEDLKNADTSLYERRSLNFRDIIDNNFPTMLIIDYNNIKQELKQYQDIEQALKTYISETYKPTEKDYKVSKLSDREIDVILKIIKRAVKLITATPISYKVLQTQLEQIVSQDLAQETGKVTFKVNQLFSKVYRLTDSIGNGDIFIFPNFARIDSAIKRPLSLAMDTVLSEEQSSLSIDSIGEILAFGHTAAGYVDDKGKPVLNFNTPKMMAIMFDVINEANKSSTLKPKESLEAATFFVQDTRQAEVFVTIDKEFSDKFANVFVSVGGNIVRFENTLINSRRGTILEKKEKRGVNRAVLEKLATAYSNASSVIGSRLARKLRAFAEGKKSSPNLIEYLVYAATAPLDGKKAIPFKSKNKETSTTKKTATKKEVVSGIVKNRTNLSKQTYSKTRTPAKNLVNLDMLMMQINSNLHDQIKANMGTGNRRDVLNYRTGRLAQSAKVERISESRQGMITAFYSYMKNPYATFSRGGRQERPYTRDPKTLISKSIRELAGQQVANRMRAVLI